MHTTASGLVLMTAWSPERLDTYLAGQLQQPTPMTTTDPAAIRDRVSRAHADGYAWSVEEATLETCGLAVPINDRRGTVVAAVGLFGPLYRLSPSQEDLGPHLAKLAAEFTRGQGP
ncbi:MAG: hypothetical protein HKN24_12295 [Acidimicrobiales bacterium]|nr:hypothetical protein [Acidimicrobiales bacterium]